MCYTYDELGRVTERVIKNLADDVVISTETVAAAVGVYYGATKVVAAFRLIADALRSGAPIPVLE